MSRFSSEAGARIFGSVDLKVFVESWPVSISDDKDGFAVEGFDEIGAEAEETCAAGSVTAKRKNVRMIRGNFGVFISKRVLFSKPEISVSFLFVSSTAFPTAFD